jgi:hypothetical protein
MSSVDPAADEPAAALGRGDPGSDWLDRVYASAPLPPWGVGLVVMALLIVLFLAMTAVTGELGAFLARGESVVSNRNARLGIILPVLGAYLPTAQRYLELASRRNAAHVVRLTGASPGEVALASRRRLVIGLSLLCVPGMALLIDRDPRLYLQAHYWSGASAGNWLVGFAVAGLLGRFGYETLARSRTFSRLADRIPDVDLFDRAWLAPFARQGLLCALLWLIVPAIFTLNLTDAPFLFVMIPVGIACAAIGTAALWLPTAGVRRRLVEAQQAEMSRVHRALRGDREAQAGLAVGEPEPSLSDLLAYERFLRGIHTMPFDLASWVRFGLYLALPLGSWLGGALVERLVSDVLD